MDVVQFMAGVAFLATMGLYATSLPLFPLLLTARRSDLVQLSRLVFSVLQCVLGVHFAVLAAVPVSILSNGIGVVLYALLSLAYLRVVPVKSGHIIFVLLGVLFYAVVAALYFYDAVAIGLFSASARTLAYTLPAMTVASAARTGNVEAISLPLTCGAFVCQVSWFVFGDLIDNPFVKLPNVPGIVVNMIAFYLLWKDDQKKKKYEEALYNHLQEKINSLRGESQIDADNNLIHKKSE